MSRKVLISFIGTGKFDFNQATSKRQYHKALYKIEGFNKEATFITQVLKQFLNADTLVLIGTMKSIWEEVYATFCSEQLDEEYYFKLAEIVDNSHHKTDPDPSKFMTLERCLGNGLKVVPVYYGINAEQFRRNTDIILAALQQNLQDGDRVYLDVTHAFRSLPLVLSQILFYFQDVSPKKIQIDRVFYGMLEVIGELGYAPIVDLSYLLELNQWHRAAYSFRNFGIGYLLGDLIEKTNNSEAKIIKTFSNALNLNLIFELENNVRRLQGILNKNYPTLAQSIIPDVLSDFVNIPLSPQSSFQYHLARWQFEHKNYAAAVTILYEAFITYVCEQNGWQWNSQPMRERAKRVMHKYEVGKIVRNYRINDIRNAVCHNLRKQFSTDNAVSAIRAALNEAKNILK